MPNNNIEKCSPMAASDSNFISEIFLNGCFSKTAENILEIHIFYIFYYDVILKKNEFLCFREKYKHIKLALNFIQKQ